MIRTKDTRNICRILTALAAKEHKLMPNSTINFKRRWPWMGRRGQVLEEHIATTAHNSV
jgi:3'-5' exoribonuclease 1